MSAANDLSDIWAVLAPMFSCITYDADGWWAHVTAPQREWNGFDKPALSRQLSGLLRMPLCGSEQIYERPIKKSSQGTSATNDLPARLRDQADCHVAAAPVDPVRVQWTQDLREAATNVARYLWLRDRGCLLIGPDRGIGPEWPSPDEVDAIVDAALAEVL